MQTRIRCATDLCEAIAEAHPDDAVQLMTAALIDLSPGGPCSSFFLDAEEDARWWASWEQPAVLVATVWAAFEALGNHALHIEMRKRLFWRLWQSFGAPDRDRFLTRVRGDA